jgi:hypothetical protein
METSHTDLQLKGNSQNTYCSEKCFKQKLYSTVNYTLHIQFSCSISLGLWDTETNDCYGMHILKLVYLAVTSSLLKMWRLHISIIHNKQILLPPKFVGLPIFKVNWSINVNSHLIEFHCFSTEMFKTFFLLLIKYLNPVVSSYCTQMKSQTKYCPCPQLFLLSWVFEYI